MEFRDYILLAVGLLTLAGLVWRYIVNPVRVFAVKFDEICEQIKVNGSEELLPRELRGRPIRTLLVHHILWSRERDAILVELDQDRRDRELARDIREQHNPPS